MDNYAVKQQKSGDDGAGWAPAHQGPRDWMWIGEWQPVPDGASPMTYAY